jgi:hypothetical protein
MGDALRIAVASTIREGLVSHQLRGGEIDVPIIQGGIAALMFAMPSLARARELAVTSWNVGCRIRLTSITFS